MKKVAILIPSYKPQSYIEKCLSSIERQTICRSKFSVYLALNGPREPYEDYVKGLLSKSEFDFNYFYLAEASVSAARNLLIDNSSEDYIVFMDDDDCVSASYIEDILMVSSCDVIGIADVKVFTPEKGVIGSDYIGKCFERLKPFEESKYRARKYFSSLMGKAIHRKIIGSTKFDVSLAKGEDSLFMTEISSNVSALKKANSEAVYYVYERELSVTRSAVNRKSEFRRLLYLLSIYKNMMLSGRSDKIFIFTRLLATLVHFARVIKG